VLRLISLLQISQDVSLYLKEALCSEAFLCLSENIVARTYSWKRYWNFFMSVVLFTTLENFKRKHKFKNLQLLKSIPTKTGYW